ncbi:MAG: Ig-like domain-containing protein, partial [Bacteroidota bacterium]
SPAAWRASPAVGGSPGGLNVSNDPPNVSITSPEPGAFIAPGSAVPVNIEAEDVDEDGRVLRVDVLLGNQLIERLSTAPYTFEIPGLAVGEYTLTAVAYDNGGARAETAPLTFTIGSEQPCALEPPALVINEINYLSPADLQSGDWAELYNPTGETVDLSGWVMKDETQTSAFTIPAGTTIAPGGYLVVAQDSTLFALAHPGVTSFVANYDFGLSSGDDIVRLYSPTGCEVDIVSYEENDPWPAEASGEGATLELINPTWDNNRPESWSPSARFGGTPGETNSFGWPRVEVVSPADGARVGQGTSVSVEAIVTTSSEVAGVTVRTNGVPIGKAQLNEKGNFYSFDWSDPEPGGYVIDLVVEDIQGRSTVSRPVQLTVLNSTALIAAGSTWRYNDTGDDLGTEWRTLEYDDSGWPTGAAQLGYGDEDEMTVISFGSDDRDKHPTAYFRHAFTIDDPSLYAALSLSILRDDGAVVYLNGTEILRSNMPDGEITFDTFAASVVKDEAEDTFVWRQIDLSTNPVLVAGTNVIAVEVHQRDAVSTDLSFDLALEGNPPGVYANVQAVLQGAFAGEAMRHELARYGWIPLQQPYAAAPWYYAGKEEVGELPDSTIVDWVLLQLRTDVGPETTVAERAAFLRSDGRIVNLDGESQVFFQGFDAGAYYLAIYHRNHLPIMTAAPVILRDSPTSPLYDFSQAMGRAYGSTEDPMVEVSPGVFALVAGDASGDNRLVRYSGPDNDRTAMLRLLNGNLADVRRGYYIGDLNLDGRVQYSGPANDRTVILRAAGGPGVVRSSQVPR